LRLAATSTASPGGAERSLKTEIAEGLAEARRRTLRLIEGVTVEDMERVHSPLMSPLAWDLGHIAAFEELWLCRRAGGLDLLRPDLAEVYDASETPRSERGALPCLSTAEALGYMRDIRERSLRVLEEVDLSPAADTLNADGFVWHMLVQHEQQHNETMLQTLQIAEPGAYRPERCHLPPAPPDAGSDQVHVPGGDITLGFEGGAFAYDNERPPHSVSLAPFRIDRLPVTAGAFADFVSDGSYGRRELWAPEGWDWVAHERAQRPMYWTAEGGSRSFDRVETLDPDLPVMHVSWFEADAYARWAGRRLPTETEWEAAATLSGDAAPKRCYPWGDQSPDATRANLDQLAFGPAPAGAYPDGAGPCGALGMIGDAWEWTASEFTGYPGFQAYPYRDYSEVFFHSGYRVLRGGSWATRPDVVRATFRNWDLPERRQIFCGFRCAEDA